MAAAPSDCAQPAYLAAKVSFLMNRTQPLLIMCVPARECLRQRGEGQLMRGVTRKEDFVALLRSSDEHRCPPPEVLVAVAWSTN